MSLSVFDFKKKLKDVDPDIRSMALSDAREQCIFNNHSTEADMVDAFLPQYISEKDVECHGEATRFLEYYIPKMSQTSRDAVLNTVKGALNAKVVTSPPELAFSIKDVEAMRQHAASTLKKIVPLLTRDDMKACTQIVKEIITHIEKTFADSFSIKREMYETLQPFLEHKSLCRIFMTEKVLTTKLYSCITQDKKVSSLESQVLRTTASLARVVPSYMLNNIVKDALKPSTIGTLSAIAGCAAERMTVYLDEAVDVAKKTIEELEEEDEKQRTAIITLYRALVEFSSSKVNPYLDDILETVVSMTRYNPNIFEDEDDEDEQEHEEQEEEEDNDCGYGGYSAGDSSWKVRCSALECLAACVRSNALAVQKLLPLLLNTTPTKATLLEKCFRDEEIRVGKKTCELLMVLVQVCGTRLTLTNTTVTLQKPLGKLLVQHQTRLLKVLISLKAEEACGTVAAFLSFLGQECTQLQETTSGAIKVLDNRSSDRTPSSADAPLRLFTAISLVATQKGDAKVIAQLTDKTVLTKLLTISSSSAVRGNDIIISELCDAFLNVTEHVQNPKDFLSVLMTSAMELTERNAGTSCAKPLQTLASMILKEGEHINTETLTKAYKVIISKLEDDHSFVVASTVVATTLARIPAPYLSDNTVATLVKLAIKKLNVLSAHKDCTLRMMIQLLSRRSAAVPADIISPLLKQPITAANRELVLQFYYHLVKMGYAKEVNAVAIPHIVSFLSNCDNIHCNLQVTVGDLFHAIATEKSMKGKPLKDLVGTLVGEKKGMAIALGALEGSALVDRMSSQLNKGNQNAGVFAMITLGEAARHDPQTALKCYPILTQETYSSNEIRDAAVRGMGLCICAHPAILQQTLTKLESSQTEMFRSLNMLREALTLATSMSDNNNSTNSNNNKNNNDTVFSQKESLTLATKHLYRVIQNGCADGGVTLGLLARWDFNTVCEHLTLLVKENKEASIAAVGSALQTMLPLISSAEQLAEITPIISEFFSHFKNESAEKREIPETIRRSAVNFVKSVLQQLPGFYNEELHEKVFDTVLQEIVPDAKHIEVQKMLGDIFVRKDPLADVRKSAIEVAVLVVCSSEYRRFVTHEQLCECMKVLVGSSATVLVGDGKKATSTPRSENDIEIQQAARNGVKALQAVPMAWAMLPEEIKSMCKPLEDVITCKVFSSQFEKNFSTVNKEHVVETVKFIEENCDELPAEFASVEKAAKNYKPAQ